MKFVLLAIILPISILPMWVLHRFSDVLCFFMYTVGKYRRRVVSENLKIAFPTKTDDERAKIEKAFYSHLCDLIFESLKSFTISREALKRRMVYRTPEVTDALWASRSNIIGVAGHYNSWEWQALSIAMDLNHIVYGVYKPLNNKTWDSLFFESRCRFGIRMIPIRSVREVMDVPADRPFLMALLSDQAPHDYEKAFEVDFLGQKTFFTPGPGVIAVQRDEPSLFAWVKKLGRSRYEWYSEVLKPDAAKWVTTHDGPQIERIARMHGLSSAQAADALSITRQFAKRLEAEIKLTPQFWLWSHRRWKQR